MIVAGVSFRPKARATIRLYKLLYHHPAAPLARRFASCEIINRALPCKNRAKPDRYNGTTQSVAPA